MTSTPTAQLSELGVSIWLDDLSRDRISSGALAALIESRNVVGVTTNPTIFAAALATGTTYDEQVSELARAEASVTDAVFAIDKRSRWPRLDRGRARPRARRRRHDRRSARTLVDGGSP